MNRLRAGSSGTIHSMRVLKLKTRKKSKKKGKFGTKVTLRATSGYSNVLIDTDNVLGATDSYPSVVGDRVLLRLGKWYYEITLTSVSDAGLLAVGWADKLFFGEHVYDKGVGDDNHSWALIFDSNEMKAKKKNFIERRTNCSGQKIDIPWKEGDVIGCYADVDQKTIGFTVNGSFATSLGIIVFDSVSFQSGLVPALSVNRSMKCQVNFGERPLSFSPAEGYRPIHQWLLEEQKRLVTKMERTSSSLLN